MLTLGSVGIVVASVAGVTGGIVVLASVLRICALGESGG